MSKPPRQTAKPLAALLGDVYAAAFAKQGFASRELVTRWREIAGPEIAEHCEPIRINWPPPIEGKPSEAATLVLRVEGPVAIEIQHSSDAIIARVNRFFGWNAIGRIALRQAPLSRPPARRTGRTHDPLAVAEAARELGAIEDDSLREALARLKTAINHS
jgi:hypothetical protein